MQQLIAGAFVALILSNGYFWYGKKEAVQELADYKQAALIAQYQAVAVNTVTKNKAAIRQQELREAYQDELKKLDSDLRRAKSVSVRKPAGSSAGRMSAIPGPAQMATETGKSESGRSITTVENALRECALQYRTLYESWLANCAEYNCTK